MKGIELKTEADIAFGRKRLNISLELYNRALGEDPSILQAYANRSALYLFQSQYDECIKDCTVILETLKSPCLFSKTSKTAAIGGIPPHGSQHRLNMVKVCLSRRALCFDKTKQKQNAKRDLDMLLKILKSSF
jgi:tetratricopeptide (TPR) repeat protein